VADIPADVDAEPGWPGDEAILTAGGEFLPYQAPGGPQGAALRELMGTGGRAVRIGGKIYAEGDIVAASLLDVGALPDDA